MIQMLSILNVADNSGAKKVRCVKVIGGSHKNIAHVGDTIVVSIRSALPRGKVKKGEVYRAIVVRTKSPVRRKDGSEIRFDNNAVVLIDKQGELIGTAISGAVPRELRALNYTRILNLAAGGVL